MVNNIVAPFGEPVEGRPQVPSESERVAEREEKKRQKDERRRARRSLGTELVKDGEGRSSSGKEIAVE